MLLGRIEISRNLFTLPPPYFCRLRVGDSASSSLEHHPGDGEERHPGDGEAAVLVRRPALLQRLSLWPDEHQGPRGAGDGPAAGGACLPPTDQPPLGRPAQVGALLCLLCLAVVSIKPPIPSVRLFNWSVSAKSFKPCYVPAQVTF